MKMIKMTQTQRNAVYVFGQKDKEATISHLLQISCIMVNKEEAAELIELSGRLIHEEITAEMWEQNFEIIRHRKEMIMNHMVADYQKYTGDYEDKRPWWTFAKQYIIGSFAVDEFEDMKRKLRLVTRLTTVPALKIAVAEAISEAQEYWDGALDEYYGKLLPTCQKATLYKFADDNVLYEKIMKGKM